MSSVVINNYITFIHRHDEYFKHYNTFADIPKSSLAGWLYIFNAICYDEDISKIFDNLVVKFGKTKNTMYERLYTYDNDVNPTNIECIHCTLPEKRERLIKAFLKYKTSIKPVAGHEYFIEGCRNLIKVLMLIMVHTSDEEIKLYEKYYAEKNMKEVEVLFSRIDSIIQMIREDDEFELQIEVDKYEEIVEEIVEPKQHICKFCRKSYTSLSNLNNHQKTAKFCIELQNKLNTNQLIRCEFCLKEFSTKKYLSQHSERCKDKKISVQKDFELENKKLNKKLLDLEQEFKNELLECKLKLEFKDELIEKMQKEIDDYKKIISRPTTIYNTNNTNNTNNNYQIEFNQLVQNTETFLSASLSNKIKSITIEEMDSYDPKNLEDSFSHTLCNKLKEYTFCTDNSRKMVVIKKENDITEKITINAFINLCLNIGVTDIRNYLKILEDHYDSKLVSYTITDENFTVFDDSLQKIKEYMNKTNIDITDTGHPLKMLPDKVLLNCRHLNK